MDPVDEFSPLLGIEPVRQSTRVVESLLKLTKVSRVAIFTKIRVQIDGMLADHVKLLAQPVEFFHNFLDILEVFPMLDFQFLSKDLVMRMRIAKRIHLEKLEQALFTSPN